MFGTHEFTLFGIPKLSRGPHIYSIKEEGKFLSNMKAFWGNYILHELCTNISYHLSTENVYFWLARGMSK